MVAMTHHAYLVEGEREVVLPRIEAYLTDTRGYTSQHDPDVPWFDQPQISVDDARRIGERAYRSAQGSNGTTIVLVTSRIFHQAQNALLKIFEEPPAGVTFILAVPQAGQLLPTLQSRLLTLPTESAQAQTTAAIASTPKADSFLALTTLEREKYITKLLDTSKVDDDDEKQRARADVAAFVTELVRALHRDRAFYPEEAWRAFMNDCHAFLPILHERSAPLKPILEHLRLTIPAAIPSPK